MTWLRDTIAGRTIIILVLGLGSILALAQYLYQAGVARAVTVASSERIAERVLFVANSILSLPKEQRDEAAHRMSGGPLDLHWSKDPLATAGGQLDPFAHALREQLLRASPDLASLGLVIGTSRAEDAAHAADRKDGHATLVSVPLNDGSWLNVTLAQVQLTRPTAPSALLSAVLGSLGIVLLSVLMGRWLTRPLDRLADGARQLFSTPQNQPLPETGTREVRTLAAAINDLQRRIRRLVDDRTQMLAAVSHDLRTPLTRLRLRVRSIADASNRAKIEADLDEMETMIDATLAFLREETSTEEVAAVDLAAIIETIAADATDAGEAVTIAIPDHLVIRGRHLALKRALINLVQNAVKYGKTAELTATLDDTSIRILIRDQGPGVPEDMLESVFQPFFRLDTSRSRDTGGHGLGLTVARTIIRSHGGDVVLRNLKPTGLEALVMVPLLDRRNHHHEDF